MVVKRRGEGQTFTKISYALGISESTVRRAWDYANQEKLMASVESGKKPDRGRYRHIPAEKIRAVQTLLKQGKLNSREIAAKTGVSQSTIRREKANPEQA